MRVPVRTIAPAAYLACCILFGGASAAGAVANGLLQLVAILILAVLAFGKGSPPVPTARTLVLGIAGFAIWLALQLVPLPPLLWTRLPGRASVVDGFALAGIVPHWEPISLVPDATAATLLALLPPAAMLAMMLAAGQRARRWAVATLIALAIGATLLGVLQVLSGEESPFHPYRITNPGHAVGPFANRNHLATLLLCAIPFVALSVERRGWRRSGAALAGIALLSGGVVLTGSDAGLALLVVVLLMLGLRLSYRHGMSSRLRRRIVPAMAVIGIIAVAMAWQLTSPDSAPGAEQRRGTTVPVTLAAAIDHLPLGAGGGSFATIYPAYTDPATASPAFVNHAHSDYVELLLDHGFVALLLIGATWWWWVQRARSAAADGLSRAALAALAMILLHSLVDYPLRTAAIAAVAAVAAALASGQPPMETGQSRASRASRELSETFDLG